jgi:Ca2+-binding RTX toxin-like protein
MPDSGRRLWPAAAITALITGLLASTAYGAVIDGTPGNDRIHGKAAPDQISALTGDDVVHARRGSDTVDLGPGNDRGFGGRGDDKVYGGDGRDTIFANKGRDTIDGGDGNDRLFALSRKDVNRPDDTEGDTVRGGTGDDRIAVRDGERDVVNCGPGVDRALLDFKDVLEDNSCEVVARRAPNRRDSRVEDRNEGDQP